MADEQKRTASEEEDSINENSNDNDQNQNEEEAGNGTPNYNLNNTVHSTNDLRSNTQQDLSQNFHEEIEVETTDVRIIQQLSDEACYKDNSDENVGYKASYEYPSDFDEGCVSPLPQAYFDSIECTEEVKSVTIEDILPVSVCRKLSKEKHIEVQDCSSDEFADAEDDSEDNLTDSNLDNNELLEDIAVKWTNSKKRPIAEASENLTQERKDNIAEKNKASENIPSNKQEDNKLPIADLEPSCSHSPESRSKRTKISASDKTAKRNMSTIIEEPEVEDDSQNSKVNPPSSSKSKSLKMKARVVKRKDKCNVCNVRLGLCAIRCRCGGYYCAKHRYDKEHNCTFDYKSMGAEEIRKNNPQVIAEKVRKL